MEVGEDVLRGLSVHPSRLLPNKCKRCSDTGLVYEVGKIVARCDCPAGRKSLPGYTLEERMTQAGVPKRYLGARLDDATVNPGIALKLKSYADLGFKDRDGGPRSLYLYSKGHGTGKTWLASAFAAYVLEHVRTDGRRCSVKMVTFWDLLGRMYKAINDDGGESVFDIQTELRSPDLLILNELPRGRRQGGKVEPISPFQQDQLEQLFTARCDEDVSPTVVTGNVALEHVAERLSPAIASRMGEEYFVRINVDGRDQRRKS